MKSSCGKNRPCGLWPLTFGGWSRAACAKHDLAYEKMLKGNRDRTLKEVDDEFYYDLHDLAERGRYSALKHVAADVMYGIAHVYGLFRFKEK